MLLALDEEDGFELGEGERQAFVQRLFHLSPRNGVAWASLGASMLSSGTGSADAALFYLEKVGFPGVRGLGVNRDV